MFYLFILYDVFIVFIMSRKYTKLNKNQPILHFVRSKILIIEFLLPMYFICLNTF